MRLKGGRGIDLQTKLEPPFKLEISRLAIFFAAGEAKNPAISAAEWLRAHLRPPWSLRFCDAILVPLITSPEIWASRA